MPTNNNNNNKSDNFKMDKKPRNWVLFAFAIIIFSCFAPIIFTQFNTGIIFSGAGEIGDVIGGIMSPFIGIAGVILTFLAFYIQYKANDLQRELFRKELKANQFENQFYEMLKLHKENVNEFEATITNVAKQTTTYKGRKALTLYMQEIEFYYDIINVKEKDNRTAFNLAYKLFFDGKKSLTNEQQEEHEIEKLNQTWYNTSNCRNFNDYLTLNYPHLKKGQYEVNTEMLLPHSSQFAHYYRHLFQTVKFVVNQDDKDYKYEDKRRYLRILRAQLSNEEQVLLFYNWFSYYGSQWQDKTNKFFTDFRMIHNITPSLIMSNIDISEFIFRDPSTKDELGRKNDTLFEFEG